MGSYIKNVDIGKPRQDSMQQGKKNMKSPSRRTLKVKFLTWTVFIFYKKNKEIMKRTSQRTFKVGFLTRNVFIFYKNLLCRLRNSCLRHNVNNGLNCK